MVDHDSNEGEQVDRGRRDILLAAGTAAVAGAALPAIAAAAQTPATRPAGNRDNGPLGGRLQGVQHFGVTVQNMDRAFEFYTEVLGGTEVMRDGDFQGERIHNTLLTDQEIVARERKVNPRTIGVPDLKGGAQRLTCASSSSTMSSSSSCNTETLLSPWAKGTVSRSHEIT